MAKQKKANQGNQEMSDALNRSEAFFDKYKKAIIGCLVALVVLIIAITM